MKGSSAFALAGLASASFNDGAPGPPTSPPNSVKIGSISYGGSGCPQGSVGSFISADRTTYTLIFDKYIAQAGPGKGITDSRKNCQINVDLLYPNGYSFSVYSQNYRGFVNLDPGVTARQKATFYFSGASAQASTSTSFTGPVSKDYLITDTIPFASAVYSPCGQEGALNINTAISVDNSGAPAGQGQLTTDSIDGKVELKFGLSWVQCNGPLPSEYTGTPGPATYNGGPGGAAAPPPPPGPDASVPPPPVVPPPVAALPPPPPPPVVPPPPVQAPPPAYVPPPPPPVVIPPPVVAPPPAYVPPPPPPVVSPPPPPVVAVPPPVVAPPPVVDVPPPAPAPGFGGAFGGGFGGNGGFGVGIGAGLGGGPVVIGGGFPAPWRDGRPGGRREEEERRRRERAREEEERRRRLEEEERRRRGPRRGGYENGNFGGPMGFRKNGDSPVVHPF